MKLRYNNGEKEHIKGHGSGEFPYRFPKILLNFLLTPHSYLQLIRMLLCDICGQDIPHICQLTQHNFEYHSSICDLEICGVVYSLERGGEGLACPISGCIKKYTTRTTFKRHMDHEHGDHHSPSPLNKGEKRACSDSERNSLKKLKSVRSEDDSLFQSMFMILSFF